MNSCNISSCDNSSFGNDVLALRSKNLIIIRSLLTIEMNCDIFPRIFFLNDRYYCSYIIIRYFSYIDLELNELVNDIDVNVIVDSEKDELQNQSYRKR